MKKLFVMMLLSCSFLFACQKDDEVAPTNNTTPTPLDPCASIICQNGGTCNNGICECPDGFYGNLCENQMPATGFRVNQIRVNSFPSTDGGAGWDLTSSAELYTAWGTNCNTGPTSYYENASNTTDYFWNVNWYTSNPNQAFKICLMDYDDFDSDDQISSISFIPSANDDGWPTFMTF
jgi:hypothetical protein